MTSDKTIRQNRVREALGKIYGSEPPFFREYLRRYQEDPTSRVFAPLAEAYRRLGRTDDAIQICREGLTHHPDFHGGRVALAKCYLDKKWYNEARGELERVVAGAPENLLAHRLLGDACAVLGDRAQALHHLKMALLLSPNDVALAERVRALEQSRPQEPEPMAVEPAPPEGSFPCASVDEVNVDPPAEAAWEVPLTPLLESVSEPAVVHEEVMPEPVQEPPTLDALLGVEGEGVEEPFRVEPVSQVFQDEPQNKAKEITTGTLGDLYFSQGQYDHALRIFEKLNSKRSTPELVRKIRDCRLKLGVDREALLRNRRIEVLRDLLRRVREGEER